MSNQPDAKRSSRRPTFVVIGGLLFVIASLVVAAWASGTFKSREKVALVTWNEDPYWDQVIAGATDAANKWNVDLTVIRSKPDEKIQSQHIRELLNQGVQGIAISPNNPTAQAALLNEAADKAVLITMDSDAPVPKRAGFIGSDNYAAGQLCGEVVRSALPEGGEVVISVGSLDLVNGRDRRQGLIDNLLDRRADRERTADPVDTQIKGDHYTVVATVLDGGDPAKATAEIAEAIKAHPNIKCAVGLFSYSAPAVVKGIAQAGKAGQIKVVGFDESDETQAGVESGIIYASILQDQYRCGYEAVLQMADALRGTRAGPTRVQTTHLRTWVLKADNIADLRAEKMVHQPTTKPANAG